MKNETLIIRKAKLSDVSQLLQLEKIYIDEHNKFETSDYKIIGFDDKKLISLFRKKIFKRNKLFLVLDDGLSLQGYLFAEVSKNKIDLLGYLSKQEPFVYLENVFISKSYRGKGYFSLLMNELLSFAKDKRITVVDLHVAFPNILAKSVYESLGFKPVVQKMRLKLKK